MKAADLFVLPPSLSAFAAHFSPEAAPWEWVRAIGRALEAFEFGGRPAVSAGGVHIEGPVFIDSSVRLPNVCTIIGPAWIGAATEIRPGAFLRGNVIAGAGCVLGNSCEFKNALLLDGVQVPHFSYVGDSVLGNKAHLGAGVILSNLRLDQKPVRIRMADGSRLDTGLRKLGALVGDAAEVGCNAVLQPGTILGRRALVHPLTPFGGELGAGMVASVRTGGIVVIPRSG